MVEKYVPSDEEVRRAEGMERDLLKEQYIQKETIRMNQALRELFPTGFTGSVDKRSVGENVFDPDGSRIGGKQVTEISGEINSHTFSVTEKLDVVQSYRAIPAKDERLYSGAVDGKPLSAGTAKELFWKYFKAARQMNEHNDESSVRDQSVDTYVYGERSSRQRAFENEEYDRSRGIKGSPEDLGL